MLCVGIWDACGIFDGRVSNRINRSLLANFVELVDILIKKPVLFKYVQSVRWVCLLWLLSICVDESQLTYSLLSSEKLDEVELLFLNMHNLINAFRPHQARETVIQMLETQVQERRDAARDIRRTIDESRRAVERVHAELHETTDDLAAAEGASTAGAGDDVKMENVDGVADIDNGDDEAHASGAVSAVTLTPAQHEHAQVRGASRSSGKANDGYWLT